MMPALRVGFAIAAGVVIAMVLAYLATIVVVLLTIGIPLGSESRPLTAWQATLFLVSGGAAAFVGARVARRIARDRVVTTVVAVLLAGLMLWGFSGRNAWPDWWGPVVAMTMAFGAWFSGSRATPRRLD